MLENNNCIFCQIVTGKLPCYKVYEDEAFLAFLDINPLNEGHALVIPKKHFRWVWDVEDFIGYANIVKKVANALRRAINTDWVVSLIFGDEVPHAHVWLVPRFRDDEHGGGINFTKRKKFSDIKMKEIAEKIKSEL